jgi:putative transposase
MYHVMSRGNFRQGIFPAADHAERYLHYLDRATRRYDWCVLDWCLLPNHYHLLVQLTNGGLSEGMRELNGCYSRWSNLIHERTGTGHLVRNRFTSRHVNDDEYLQAVLRYIPRNPVEAGLVRTPEDWPWGGYRATIGLEHPRRFHRPAEVLRYFSPDPTRARRLYQAHVMNGPVVSEHDLWSDDGVRPSVPSRG